MLLTNIENLMTKLKGNYKEYVIKELIRIQNWGIKKYPAEHMGVILWNHGGGALGGVCMDEKNNNDTFLSQLPKPSEIPNDVKYIFVGQPINDK